MNKFMLDRLRSDTPPLNPDIANGLATRFIPMAQQYIDSVWKVVSKDFPEGLEYKGITRCTPYEEFYNDTRKKNERKIVDIARSDIYMLKAEFTYRGNPLPPRYFFLPFVGEAGSLALGGPTYFMSPVVSDVILSFEQDNVFVKLLRDRFALRRVPHNVIINGRIETIPVVWSMIYHVKATQRKAFRIAKAECSLFHYLLCRYGFSEIFKRFYNCTPILSKEPFDRTLYPPNEWVFIESSQFKPKTISSKFAYIPTDIRIAVRTEEFTPEVKSMLAGFYYVVDHFPNRVEPEYVDDVRLWKVLLGHLIFGSESSEGKLHDDTDEHIRSLYEYVDVLMRNRFKEIDIAINDIYEFFVIAIERFNQWILSAKDRTNSLYEKELNILQDSMMPITSLIFSMHFKLKSAMKEGLEEKDIIGIMNKYLRVKSVFDLTKQIGGVSNMSYSGDNKCMKITATVVSQKDTNGKSSKNSQNLDDPTKRLHVSFAEVGSYIHLSDSNLTGEDKINPHIQLNRYCKIVRDPKLKPLLDKVQEMISRE